MKDRGSAKRFGYEWNKYNQIVPDHEEQFLKWSFPLTKADFKDKMVLDAGCGIGRNSYFPLVYGAKEVVAFDYDKRSVSVAKKNLKNFKNARVEFCSIYEPKYKDKFDISFSIGVIHHLEYPRKAIKTLVEATKKNGKVFIWVYGKEGVGTFVTLFINPLRKVTSVLPPQLTDKFAYLFSIPLYIFLKLFPHKNPYFKQLSRFQFWHVHHIIFDQLLPKIANYYRKEEALDLLKGQGLKNIKIYRVNDISWTVMGEKE